MEHYVIGIDLGGTKVEACLLDKEKNVHRRHRSPSEPHKGLERVIRNIEAVVHEVSAGSSYAAIGMGTAGTYVERQDRLYGSPHTPVYETPGFIGRLRERFSLPLIIENDANCLALAEYFAARAGRLRNIMAVIIGTGMGSGLILEGRLYRGASHSAGEIGHTTIKFDGRLCECGRRGCAEAYLSGPSHIRRFQELTGHRLEVEKIYERYISNDPLAVRLFDESCRMMGEVFANVINAFDLEAIILGGGLSNLPLWYEKVPPLVEKSLFGIPRIPISLIKAGLGDSAGVIGAGCLALRELGYMDF